MEYKEKTSWYNSIRLKLTLGLILVSIGPLGFSYFAALNSIEEYYLNERLARLLYSADFEAELLSNVNYLQNLNDAPFIQFQNIEVSRRARSNQYRIIIIDAAFNVVFDTNATQTGNIFVDRVVIAALTQRNETGVNRENRAVYSAAAIFNENGERAGVALISQNAEDIFESLDAIRQMFLLYSFLAILLLTFLSLIAQRALLYPLKGLTMAAWNMSQGRLDVRVPVKGKDEYALLAYAFNDMIQKLAEVNKAREEFVSNVSHELKTPLSSIKSLTGAILLADDASKELYREFLQDVSNEVDRLTLIINDLLRLVKLDNHKLTMSIDVFSLNNLVSDIVKRYQPLAIEKNIRLTQEHMRKIKLECDDIKLGTAIANIIENAIKYTPKGGSVKVEIDSDYNYAFIIIRDTGIGIPEEEQGKVFNRFYRVDKTRDRDAGGTGLGLAISHAAVLAHNGGLRLSSKPGEGSVFTIRVPFKYKIN